MKTNFSPITPVSEYRQNTNSVKYLSFKSSVNTSKGDIVEISSNKSADSSDLGLLNRLNLLARKLLENFGEEKAPQKQSNNILKQREPEPKKELHNLYPESDKEAHEKLRESLNRMATKTEVIPIIENTRIKVKDSNGKQGSIGVQNEPEDYKIFHGTRAGSNTGFYAERLSDNTLYYIKTQNGKQNIREYIASQFYKAAGIDTPDVDLIVTENYKNYTTENLSEYWIRSKVVTGLQTAYSKSKAAYDGFAVDAWLANWDAVIYGNAFVKDGNSVRLDFGGALDFRAMGKRKSFGNKVTEISTLLNPDINFESACLYINMKREDLINSLKRVQSVTGEDFNRIALPCKNYVDTELFITLQNRQKYLGLILDAAENTPMKPDETILDYVKGLESAVDEQYGDLISGFDKDKEKRERILADSEAQRDSVCTMDDLKELWKVKTGYCQDVNEACINGDEDNRFLKQLDRAMSNVKLTEDAVLYRADRLVADGRLSQRYVQDLPEYKGILLGKDKLPSMDELIKSIYQEGKVVEEKQFISTSLDKNIANMFHSDKSILYKFNAPKGLKAVSMEHFPDGVIPKGRDGILERCNNGTYEGNEKEILVGRNFKYQMKNLTFEDGHYIIECDIL